MPAKITRSVEVTVTMSGFDMGRAFANLSSDEQAQFWNGVGVETKGWDAPTCIQWQKMRDELERLPQGLHAFTEIAEYAPDFQPT